MPRMSDDEYQSMLRCEYGKSVCRSTGNLRLHIPSYECPAFSLCRGNEKVKDALITERKMVKWLAHECAENLYDEVTGFSTDADYWLKAAEEAVA